MRRKRWSSQDVFWCDLAAVLLAVLAGVVFGWLGGLLFSWG